MLCYALGDWLIAVTDVVVVTFSKPYIILLTSFVNIHDLYPVLVTIKFTKYPMATYGQ